MILAILQDASTAEILLNNLSEADFNLEDVSVLMADANLRNAIANDAGPLQGLEFGNAVEGLTSLGVSKENAVLCREAMDKGQVLVVMDVADEFSQIAEEMFQDHSAQLIKG
jgi:hypothetical protein